MGIRRRLIVAAKKVQDCTHSFCRSKKIYITRNKKSCAHLPNDILNFGDAILSLLPRLIVESLVLSLKLVLVYLSVSLQVQSLKDPPQILKIDPLFQSKPLPLILSSSISALPIIVVHPPSAGSVNKFSSSCSWKKIAMISLSYRSVKAINVDLPSGGSASLAQSDSKQLEEL
jgi:hypothetical protein